jgi:SsrA-binding protein
MDVKVVATNRKARHEYFILETYEAGLGVRPEIKSIAPVRSVLARLTFKWKAARPGWSTPTSHHTKRPATITTTRAARAGSYYIAARCDLWEAVRLKGVTVIPLRVYLKRQGESLKSPLAKGKNSMISAAIAERDARREIERGFAAGSNYAPISISSINYVQI